MLVEWTLDPERDVNYDLYVKKSSCPGTTFGSYDDKSSEGTGSNDVVETCMTSGSGRSMAQVEFKGGTGSYKIFLTRTPVECCSNDLNIGDGNVNNDRSSACIAKYGESKPQCITGGVGQYTCRAPESCNTNPDCPTSQCCDKVVDPTVVEGTCVDTGTIDQPYLCTR